MEFSKENIRRIIWYNKQRGLMPKRCKQELDDQILGDKAHSRDVIYFWYKRFTCDKQTQQELDFHSISNVSIKIVRLLFQTIHSIRCYELFRGSFIQMYK